MPNEPSVQAGIEKLSIAERALTGDGYDEWVGRVS